MTGLSVKLVATAVFTTLAAVETVVGAVDMSAAIPGIATLIGLAALVWKLVSDHTIEREQSDRYQTMLNRADDRIVHLEHEVAELQRQLSVALSRTRDE